MQAKPDFILPLSDASAGLSQVGGKSASLARMAAVAFASSFSHHHGSLSPICDGVRAAI